MTPVTGLLLRCNPTLRAMFAAAAICTAASAEASFIAVIDQFDVTRNGVSFFSDSFSDGIAPPSPNYSLTGPSQTESGGTYAMDSTLGAYVLAGDGTARLRNVNTLPSSTDATNSGLKPGTTFSVSGRFALSSVATPDPRDLYGIALKNATSAGGPGAGATTGQIWSLDVGRIGNGLLGVHLILQDYDLNTISVVASAALDTSHDQILLRFDRNSTASNLAAASFQYWDGGAANGGFITVGNATLFNGLQWARADFHTNQETPVVPVPATLLLLLAGLGLLGFARRR